MIGPAPSFKRALHSHREVILTAHSIPVLSLGHAGKCLPTKEGRPDNMAQTKHTPGESGISSLMKMTLERAQMPPAFSKFTLSSSQVLVRVQLLAQSAHRLEIH